MKIFNEGSAQHLLVSWKRSVKTGQGSLVVEDENENRLSGSYEQLRFLDILLFKRGRIYIYVEFQVNCKGKPCLVLNEFGYHERDEITHSDHLMIRTKGF